MLKWAAQSLESLDQIAARAKDTHPQGSDDGTEPYFPVDEEEEFLFGNDANVFQSTSTFETHAQSSQDDDQGAPTESTIYKSKFSAPTIRVAQEARSQRLDREARELGWDQEELKAEYDANLEKLQAQLLSLSACQLFSPSIFRTAGGTESQPQPAPFLT
ncbi:hypothetical protein CYMTET_20215 [Cymbomonas tetramitiformis]|uniref:Uncharacterized protein n=1 Tax=Cymbomonas tetramitiformis TaxID=36881 RepID=A0AAE0G4I8_9CHLO|nr:hypothetical protein CYMTET_20215 [Cymbomonas tetramitiformis]